MSSKQTGLWLRAIRSGKAIHSDLVRALGEAGSISDIASNRSSKHYLPAVSRAIEKVDPEVIEQDLAWLAQPDHHLVTWEDEEYPPLLRSVPGPPAALFVNGNKQALWHPQLAIIGSRNPTSGGVDHARSFSAELTRRGLAVTSGLASGIDGAAHAGALDAGGMTIAVAGNGLDRVYPAANRDLARRIPEHGAIVSEYPPGTKPRKHQFPERNRIISGLSMGVLVVEAGLNSGTLITARHAAEQGREVFALPGSLHNPMVKGCHRLIKEGARLAESVHDIISALAPVAGELAQALESEMDRLNEDADSADRAPDELPDEDYRRLWDALAFDARPVDELVQMTGLKAREVSSMLLMLELKGQVVREQGDLWMRAAKGSDLSS